MDRLVFEADPPLRPTAPERADVVCFVGFLALRAGISAEQALEPIETPDGTSGATLANANAER